MWTERPLPSYLLQHAAEGVHLLLELWRRMSTVVTATGVTASSDPLVLSLSQLQVRGADDRSDCWKEQSALNIIIHIIIHCAL